MLLKTSTLSAPWTIVEGNDKGWARVKVLRTVAEGLAGAAQVPSPRSCGPTWRESARSKARRPARRFWRPWNPAGPRRVRHAEPTATKIRTARRTTERTENRNNLNRGSGCIATSAASILLTWPPSWPIGPSRLRPAVLCCRPGGRDLATRSTCPGSLLAWPRPRHTRS